MKHGGAVRRTGFAPALLGGLAIVAGLQEGLGAPARLAAPLVVTQVPRGSRVISGSDEGALRQADQMHHARLVLVSPEGQVQLLSEGFESACDPNVSFDGQRLLFAGKRAGDAYWRIWEMGLNGSGLRAVSPEQMDSRHPIYSAALFTLNSPEPWPAAVFVGRDDCLNETGRSAASSLYNVKLDGTELRKLTYNPNQNLDPFQMWDGRIIYAAERYPNEPSRSGRRVGLYAVHVEGSDMEFYGGGQGKRIQQMPCATDEGLVVFVESDEAAADGSGQLGCVDERRPHVTYRPLTCPPSFVFRYPAPLGGARILVSRRAVQGRGDWGIFAFDTPRSVCEPVFDTPDYDEVQAVPAASRRSPDGHSTAVDTKFNTGIFYGLNCYDADSRLARHMMTGMVKRVRFIEGVPQPASAGEKAHVGLGPFVPRRLVGEAPVEPDGSFNVEVPADIPLLLQTVDEQGLALANCGWIWVKPQEKRGCIGCHEDPERIPENAYVQALRRPSNRLVLPPQARRVVSFRDDVAPILQRHCASADCHGGDDTPLHLPLGKAGAGEADLEQAYAALMAPAASPAFGTIPEGRYVDAGRARTSWLVWQLAGQDLSRPWDAPGHAGQDREITRMPPQGKASTPSPEELRTLFQWIDIGAPFGGPAKSPETK